MGEAHDLNIYILNYVHHCIWQIGAFQSRCPPLPTRQLTDIMSGSKFLDMLKSLQEI